MLENLSKIVAMLGIISTAVLGWLYFFYEPPVGLSDALDALSANTTEATQTEDSARDTLARLTDATRTVSENAADKGYSDLPPLLITEDPIWVERNRSANWRVPGVGQVSFGLLSFNGGRAVIKYGDTQNDYPVGQAFDIPGSTCKIFLEAVDLSALRAGFRRSCP